MEPDERGLEAVRLILAQREAGATYRAIVEQLEAADLPTKRGKRWAPMTVRNVWLARDRYAEVLSAAA
jgi:hypothetical protein